MRASSDRLRMPRFLQGTDKGKRNPHPSRPGSYAPIEADGDAIPSLDDPTAKIPVGPHVDDDASDERVHHLGLWKAFVLVPPDP
jgi:hypothetical protein